MDDSENMANILEQTSIKLKVFNYTKILFNKFPKCQFIHFYQAEREDFPK